MSATTTQPLTVQEFDRLDLPQDRNWELHDGEVVEVPFPHYVHRLFQMRLVEVFRPLFPQAKLVMECPFQIGDRDQRSADLGVVSMDRSQAASQNGILTGAPDLVVEVLSPSNTVLDLKRYQRLCLSNGTAVFWVLDPEEKTVDVLAPGAPLATYTVHDSVPLTLFGVTASIPVAQLFEGI